ncbi:MAG: hypothetical protein IJU37_10880 [Desulfovibrio sp.]|nr:hypothetical protein [Desulfovibrio sp.]
MADMAYINAFLNRDGVEGPCVNVGYIPCRPGNFYGRENQDPDRYTAFGVSGVTIATGVDLGQTDVSSLKGYGAPASLIEKLKPYIGLKQGDAIRKLSKLPLTISKEEASLLDTCVHTGYLDRYVRPAYERAAGFPFDDLPRQAQAVVFSMVYQLGSGGVKKRAPKTWAYLTTRNWAEASHELMYGFGGDYKLRRKLEGALLKELL